MKEKVSVPIYGRTYDFDTDVGDALYISSLASYVDQKMQEIAKSTNIVDSMKLAVLAALNIADELHRLRENKDTFNNLVNKKTDELLILLNTVLQ